MEDQQMASNSRAQGKHMLPWRYLAFMLPVLFLSGVAAFSYVMTFSGATQRQFLEAFHEGGNPGSGYRRNHAKGVCVVGNFSPSRDASHLFTSSVFSIPKTPVIGRFSVSGPDPYHGDTVKAVRGIGLQFHLANGEEWRTAMIDIPAFPAASAQDALEFFRAGRLDPVTHKPDPRRVATYMKAHPAGARAARLIGLRQVSSGFEDDTYNSLNAFHFEATDGAEKVVRWALKPEQDVSKGEASDTNFLFHSLALTLRQHPLKWRLVVTLADPNDKESDASIVWPTERQTIDAGELTIESLSDAPTAACQDVVYDPLILPSGMHPSSDPLLAARSSVYMASFVARAGEQRERNQEKHGS
ncbi:catalase family peroxidase [Komagataeibacter rhaeticus]